MFPGALLVGVNGTVRMETDLGDLLSQNKVGYVLESVDGVLHGSVWPKTGVNVLLPMETHVHVSLRLDDVDVMVPLQMYVRLRQTDVDVSLEHVNGSMLMNLDVDVSVPLAMFVHGYAALAKIEHGMIPLTRAVYVSVPLTTVVHV